MIQSYLTKKIRYLDTPTATYADWDKIMFLMYLYDAYTNMLIFINKLKAGRK